MLLDKFWNVAIVIHYYAIQVEIFCCEFPFDMSVKEYFFICWVQIGRDGISKWVISIQHNSYSAQYENTAREETRDVPGSCTSKV